MRCLGSKSHTLNGFWNLLKIEYMDPLDVMHTAATTLQIRRALQLLQILEVIDLVGIAGMIPHSNQACMSIRGEESKNGSGII